MRNRGSNPSIHPTKVRGWLPYQKQNRRNWSMRPRWMMESADHASPGRREWERRPAGTRQRLGGESRAAGDEGKEVGDGEWTEMGLRSYYGLTLLKVSTQAQQEGHKLWFYPVIFFSELCNVTRGGGARKKKRKLQAMDQRFIVRAMHSCSDTIHLLADEGDISFFQHKGSHCISFVQVAKFRCPAVLL